MERGLEWFRGDFMKIGLELCRCDVMGKGQE